MATIVNTSAMFSDDGGGSGVATSAQDIGFTPTVGNHLFIIIGMWNAGTGGSGIGITSVTDGEGGNTYAEDSEATVNLASGSGGSTCTIYSSKIAVASGAFVVTVDPTPASGNFVSWIAVEVSGLDAATHLDRTGTNTSTSTSTDASVTASAANTTNDGIAFAAAAVPNDDTDINISDTPPSGYTLVGVQENSNITTGFAVFRKIYSSGETSSASFTHDNVSQSGWSSALATYKAAAGGGGGTTSTLPPSIRFVKAKRRDDLTRRQS